MICGYLVVYRYLNAVVLLIFAFRPAPNNSAIFKSRYFRCVNGSKIRRQMAEVVLVCGKKEKQEI